MISFPAPSPPLEVLAAGLDQSSLVGKNLTAPMEHLGYPVTVNTVDRELFHYKSDTHSLYRSTLDSNISEVSKFGHIEHMVCFSFSCKQVLSHLRL